MYGTLGYIDNGRRTPHRDAAFLGSNGHPARRDMYGARRPYEVENAGGGGGTTMASNAVALLERRCVFLEEQEKRRGAEVADLRARLAESHVESVTATVLEPTVQVKELEPMGAEEPVAAGSTVQLQYPMKRIQRGKATQVWMRRREVDPHVAAVSYTWILLFEEVEGSPDRLLVCDFR